MSSGVASNGQPGHKARMFKPAHRFKAEEVRAALYLLIPSLVGFSLFYLYPALRNIYMSLTDWDLLTDPEFIGFSNYSRLFDDRYFWNSLRVTATYVLYNIPIQTVIGLGMALLLNHLKKWTSLRGLVVLPYFIPNVVVGLLWLMLLNPIVGPVNQLLLSMGFERIQFLRLPTLALPTIAGINIWRHMGFVAILFFAGLQTIPNELYECAKLDGASAPRIMWKITLPLLRPVMTFVVVTSVIGSFQIFDTVAVTTEGGPMRSTEVLIWFVYRSAFERFNMGYGAAVTVVLFVILMGFTLAYVKITRGTESDLG